MAPGLKDILNIYRNNSLFTRLHIWVRFKTCPFLLIEKFVPREGLIIDYGCGHGIFTHILSMLSPLREVYGFDISCAKLKEANKSVAKESRINFLNNIEKVESLIKKANCITMLDVLAYFPGDIREDMLRRFYDNLRPGSILIIKDIQKTFSMKYGWLYLQEKVAVKFLKITEAASLNFLNIEYLSNLLKKIGFNVRVIDLHSRYLYPHAVYICNK